MVTLNLTLNLNLKGISRSNVFFTFKLSFFIPAIEIAENCMFGHVFEESRYSVLMSTTFYKVSTHQNRIPTPLKILQNGWIHMKLWISNSIAWRVPLDAFFLLISLQYFFPKIWKFVLILFFAVLSNFWAVQYLHIYTWSIPD